MDSNKITDMNIYQKAVNHYGKEHQLLKAVEEIEELNNELTKFLSGRENNEEVAEEAADVEIMFNQLGIIYGIDTSNFKVKNIQGSTGAKRIMEIKKMLHMCLDTYYNCYKNSYYIKDKKMVKTLKTLYTANQQIRILFNYIYIDNQIAFKLNRLNKRMEGEI